MADILTAPLLLVARYLLSAIPGLTGREADVLARLAFGLSNADVASNLGTTEKTVKNILLPIPHKVGMTDDRGGSVRVRLAIYTLSILPTDLRERMLDAFRSSPLPPTIS